jgi:predicted ATPase
MSWGQGAEIGGYVVEGVLGGGATAVVYAARHRLLGTHHAIKVLAVDAPDLRERLLREAAVHTRLDHPNLVPVRDVIEADEGAGVVMPLVRGPTLSALLASRPLAEGEGIALFRGIVAGVRHAHAAGVAHRDLKPGNVLLDLERGGVVPRVTDFGLARLQGEDGSDTIVGTPGYVAPEQRHDPAAAGPRADLYALGCVLYELLTGQRAFPDPLVVSRRRAAALPARWAPLVEALLEPDPARRPSADDVLRELDQQPAVSLGPGSTLARDAARATPPLLTERPLPGRADGPPHNLEPETDEFVGRDPELGRLGEEVGPGRLVTLVGPAGVGKTRLARRFGRQTLQGWPGGVWMCALEGARSEPELIAAMLGALELPPGIGARMEGALATFAGAVVLLDNLEQLEPEAVRRLGALVEAAPLVAFLGTSREPLGLPVERPLPVQPLGEGESVRLFVRRAAVAGAPLDLAHEATATSVSRLVQLLDGLPLALEIAAARVALVSPRSLAEQLSDQLDAQRPGEGPSRQRTLRAALDASWDLLEPWERAAWAQLSVFEGGFSLEAADAVLGPEARPPEGWIERVVERLIRRSLVRIEEEGPAVRYGMLVTVAAYARERLADLGGGRAAEARHGAWFAREGQRWLEGPGTGPAEVQRRWMRVRDRPNLVAAARRALRRGEDEVATHAALGALVVLAELGPFDAAVELGQAALGVAEPGPARGALQALTAEALGNAGHLEQAAAMLQEVLEQARGAQVWVELQALYSLGEVETRRSLDRAQDVLQTLQARAIEAGSLYYEARALMSLSDLWGAASRPRDAEAAAQRALELLEALDEPPPARLLSLQATSRGQLGQVEASLALAHEGLVLAERQRDPLTAAKLHNTLGNLAVMQQRWEDAERHRKLAIQLYRRIGHEVGCIVPMHNLADLYTMQDRIEEARALHQEALALSRRTGDTVSESYCMFALGLLESAQDNLPEARDCYRAAIAVGLRHDRSQAGFCRANLAMVLDRMDEPDEALREAELAVQELADTPSLRPVAENAYATALHSKGETRGALAYLQGRDADIPPGAVLAHRLRLLSFLHEKLGEVALALQLAEQALPMVSSVRDYALNLTQLGHYAVRSGDLERARRALAELRDIAAAHPAADPLVESLQAELDAL